MKKCIHIIMLWLIIPNTLFAIEPFLPPLAPFQINDSDDEMADVWYIPTDGIEGNQVIGQFHRVINRSPNDIVFTIDEVDQYINIYGKSRIRLGSGNYFLTYRDRKFYFITVTRDRSTDKISRDPIQYPADNVIIEKMERDFLIIFVKNPDPI